MRWLRGEVDYEANERYKLRKKDALETIASKGGMIGVYSFPLWSTDAGQVKFDRELIDGMCKVNKNHFRLYNEYIDSPDLKVRVEEPISAQDLYAVRDNCIQEVLTNKNADCAALLKKANDDFQHNYLDILEN